VTRTVVREKEAIVRLSGFHVELHVVFRRILRRRWCG
jgi:hypothetical protein